MIMPELWLTYDGCVMYEEQRTESFLCMIYLQNRKIVGDFVCIIRLWYSLEKS